MLPLYGQIVGSVKIPCRTISLIGAIAGKHRCPATWANDWAQGRKRQYNIVMRYYLPMTRPEYEDENESHGYYPTTLDVTKMPMGMTAGEYAFVVVHNMSTRRSIENYSHDKMHPWLTWDTVIAHVQEYGRDNGWAADDAERAVRTMLRKGATVGGNWKSTLVEWPFSGDACLLAWAEAVVQTGMLTVRDTKRWSTEEKNTDTCTQLGRWLAQRTYLLPQASPVLQAIAAYVQAVAGMSEPAFEFLAGKYHSEQVLRLGGTRVGRANNKPMAQDALSRVFPRPENTDWSDTAFRSFALGMAWEMRAQGNPRAFNRLTQLLNRNKAWTSSAQLALCMQDTAWVGDAMQDMVVSSSQPIDDKSSRGLNGNDGMEAFYPVAAGTLVQQEQHNVLVRTIEAMGNAQWAKAFCRRTLFLALQGTFHNSGHWGHQAHVRLQAMVTLLPMLAKDERDALFTEFVLALPRVGKRSSNNYHVDNPWMAFADAMFNAWAIPRHDNEVEETSVIDVFVAWLDAWEHPFQADVKMMVSIAIDCGQFGEWLHDLVERNAAPSVSGEMRFDLPNTSEWDVSGLF